MKSGILLGGSPWGGVNTKISAGMQAELTRYDISYKSNMMLGYRFRVPHYDIPAFLDIDAMMGLNNWNSAYKEKSNTPEPGNGVISKLKMYKKWQCWMYNFWQYAMYRFNILLTISILLFYFIFFIKKSLSVIHSVTVPFKLYHLTMIKQSVKYCCCQHLVIKCFCPLTGGFVGCDYH